MHWDGVLINIKKKKKSKERFFISLKVKRCSGIIGMDVVGEPKEAERHVKTLRYHIPLE